MESVSEMCIYSITCFSGVLVKETCLSLKERDFSADFASGEQKVDQNTCFKRELTLPLYNLNISLMVCFIGSESIS